MLLRDSLGHINCHTTVIAEVTESLAHLQETLSTIQMASRIRRTQKRTKVVYMQHSAKRLKIASQCREKNASHLCLILVNYLLLTAVHVMLSFYKEPD